MLEERQKEVERLRLTIASEEKAKRERDTALQHAETLKHLNKEVGVFSLFSLSFKDIF